MVHVTTTTTPGAGAGDYDMAYAAYRALYPALRDTFATLADV
jgi:hypothetical protein